MTSIPLALLFLLAAVFSLYELIRFRARAPVESYIADREAQATHLIMNGGMAAMVSPLYDVAIERGIVVTYAAGIAILAVRFVWLTSGPASARVRAAGSAYHLLGLAAMLYAISLMPADMAMHGHDGMAMSGANRIAVALGVIFLLDGALTLVLAGFLPRTLLRMERSVSGDANRADRATLNLIRFSAFPHVVMDAGMALMLLG